MKILLFGATGQLGHEWHQFFAELNLGWMVIPYTSSQMDITRYEKVKHELDEQQPDLIINCAAYTNVDDAEEEREKALSVNAGAVHNLAGLCERLNIKLIHFSTDYIFAGKKDDRRKFPKGYPEDHRANPVNWYGETKWEGEQAIRESGCRHLIMRVSWLCGAYGGNFVKTMLRLSENYDKLDVVEDQTGSPTFTDNLVQQTFKLIEEEREGTYHLSAKGMISWADFAEAIFDISAKNVHINRIPSAEYPTKAERPFFSKLDTAKIESISGIEMEDWRAGLERLLQKINQTK